MTTLISGSNQPNSYTLKLATYYQKELEKRGYHSNLFSLVTLPDDIVYTNTPKSDGLKSIQQLIDDTDKFLFFIPEYNGSFPGILKLFIDRCDFPHSFQGKKTALVGLSAGRYGNIRGVEHFTGVCHYLNMHVMPLKIYISAIQKELDENGNLYKEDTIRFTHQQMEQFIAY